jgi:hypothetical protein
MKEILEGLKLLQIDDNSAQNVKNKEDIFLAYREFSAYRSEPSHYSASASSSCTNDGQTNITRMG